MRFIAPIFLAATPFGLVTAAALSHIDTTPVPVSVVRLAPEVLKPPVALAAQDSQPTQKTPLIIAPAVLVTPELLAKLEAVFTAIRALPDSARRAARWVVVVTDSAEANGDLSLVRDFSVLATAQSTVAAAFTRAGLSPAQGMAILGSVDRAVMWDSQQTAYEDAGRPAPIDTTTVAGKNIRLVQAHRRDIYDAYLNAYYDLHTFQGSGK